MKTIPSSLKRRSFDFVERERRFVVALLFGLALATIPASADITYIEAVEGAAGNTFATGGSQADSSWLNTTSNNGNNNSSQWVQRSPFSNGGNVFQAAHSSSPGSIPELTTQITGLADGTYDIWAFFWDQSDAWTISAGLSSGSLTSYSNPADAVSGTTTTGVVDAATLSFTTSVMTSESPRSLFGIKLGQATVSGGSTVHVYVDNQIGGSGNKRTWYDGVGYALESDGGDGDPDPDPSSPANHLLGIEFNRNDALGSPSQSLFRIVSGSTSQRANDTSYTKTIGAHQVTISQPNGVDFEFRGANTDSTRAIPGGDTSLSYLAADFIATREGAIDIEVTGLASGDYVFRSWHLDTITGSTLGYAQGANTTTANTIEARLGGALQASVQPTALGSAGLNTTFIDDSDIPTLEFSFAHDGSSPLTIELRSTQPNGAANFLLLNGFELFQGNQ